MDKRHFASCKQAFHIHNGLSARPEAHYQKCYNGRKRRKAGGPCHHEGKCPRFVPSISIGIQIYEIKPSSHEREPLYRCFKIIPVVLFSKNDIFLLQLS